MYLLGNQNSREKLFKPNWTETQRQSGWFVWQNRQKQNKQIKVQQSDIWHLWHVTRSVNCHWIQVQFKLKKLFFVPVKFFTNSSCKMFEKLDITQYYVEFNHKRWFLVSVALFVFGIGFGAIAFPNLLPMMVKKVNVSFFSLLFFHVIFIIFWYCVMRKTYWRTNKIHVSKSFWILFSYIF